jgi:hypothetical protein
MAESVTISRKEPALKSMNYAFLREQGIQHIQRLAGKLWTNFNHSDPGLTILEVLSYAITDLGYRSSYEIKDLIAADPSDPAAAQIRNFFTACEILPNAPVTIKDYRKLMMDVDVHDPSTPGAEFVGVKNAWIDCSEDAEKKLYVWRKKSKLDYEADPANTETIDLEVLYNVLLEFEACEEFGDLNENTIEGIATLYAPAGSGTLSSELIGTKVIVEVQFPRWDDKVDWNDTDEIRKNTRSVYISFPEMPYGYKVEDYLLEEDTNYVRVGMTYPPGPDPTPSVEAVINDFIYNSTTGMVEKYQRKVKKILQIIEKVKATLMANRNLCEDFFRIRSLKVEEVAVCGDIELTNEANVENVLAEIYHSVEKYLSPTVYFYDLEEMFDKGKRSEDIFEGPKLSHGFIDDDELENAERRDSVHVSDLINIIMDIPGVLAVKNLQVANIPSDKSDKIREVVVKWCLQLAVDKGYVPRLTTERSSFTFYKNQLPYKAEVSKVESLLAQLKSSDRQQKIHSADLTLDIAVPEGEYKAAGDYTSIQDEFPLVYGIGYEGLPTTATDLRKAQAKQLKGFLMFFDQLLVNYLSQLENVRELFAMNAEKDQTGEYIINRSYFTKNLINIVPDAAALYVDQFYHQEQLDLAAERKELFESRRNKFLDHLMARFSEQFTDYVMLSYTLTGAKTPEELIEDKLAFLNAYPAISAGRDKGFNYKDPCSLWNIDNVSGLEKRVSLLAGFDARTADHLVFTSRVNIYQATQGFVFEIIDIDSTAQTVLLESAKSYATIEEAKLAVEDMLSDAVVNERYKVIDSTGRVADDYNFTPTAPFEVAVICDGEAIAKVPGSYSTKEDALAAISHILDETMPVVEAEFYGNAESNRNNRSCTMENYFLFDNVTTSIIPNISSTYTISYTLFDEPFDFSSGNKQLLTGSYTANGAVNSSAQQLEDKANAMVHDVMFGVLKMAIDIDNYAYRTTMSGSQVFDITDRCGNIFATSVEENFNEDIRLALQSSLIVKGSTYNDNTLALPAYSVLNTYTLDRDVVIEVAENIPSLLPDGYVELNESYTVASVNQLGRTFTIASNVSRKLFPGELLTISGAGLNNGTYTVKRVKWDGTSTSISVVERIDDPASTGTLAYTKKLRIVGVDNGTNGNYFTIRPLADEGAANEMMNDIRERFFSNEGFHLVEHILLRPKTNEDVYLPLKAANGLELPDTNTLSLGSMEYTVIAPIVSVTTNKVILAGNVASQFYTGKEVTVVNSNFGSNDGVYLVASATYIGPDTEVRLQKNLPDQSSPYGELRYRKSTAISSIEDYNTILVSDPAASIYSSDPVIISGATDIANNGKFMATVDTNDEIRLTHRLTSIKDALLPIDMKADCVECRITNPYSFIASIVLPYWQGRFTNMDFRRFLERTMRLECPAHIALNICWVNCLQMEEFEEKYKRWMVENSKCNKDLLALSIALGELIDILVRLRSVYPPGNLHDCGTDPKLKNSIILNNSVIGNCNN